MPKSTDIRVRVSRSSKTHTVIVPATIFVFGVLVSATAQTNNYFGTTGTLNGNVWSTIPGGPYTAALNTSGGAIINFNNPTTSITGATIQVAGINATANATVTNPNGTIGNFGGGIVPINVIGGATLDFGSQGFTTAAGAGYRKEGDGVLALAGGTYPGGFTLNAGTVIVRGVNALGSTGTLTINGGTIAANASRDLSTKYTSGIVIGGDFTLGATTGLASSGANLTFASNVALGSGIRKITIGGTGTYILGGGISGTGGLTVDSTAAGMLVLSGTNTYQGPTTIQSGTVRFTKPAALYNGLDDNWTATNLVVHGQASAVFQVGGTGEFGASDITTILAATGLQSNANLVLDTGNATTGKFVQVSPLVEPTGQTVNLIKEGFGTLALAANNLVSGQTIIRGGSLQIGDGGTTGDLGSSSTVVNNGSMRIQRAGEFQLSQSISGTGSLIHTGAGKTTLTGPLTYNGTTTVTGGTLVVASTAGLANGGSMLVSGAAGASFHAQSAGAIVFNSGITIGSTGESGAVVQDSGTLNITNASNHLTVGAGGYGSYTLNGGSLSITGTTGARIGGTNSTGQGVFTQTDGTIDLSRTFAVGISGGSGIATFTGGTLTTSTSYGLVVGESGSGSGTLNVGTQAGGNAVIVSQASGLSPGLLIGSGATGTVNLNSGTVRVSSSSIRKGSSSAVLNLNGGTIQAGSPSATLIEAAVPTTVFRGGVVIDTQANSATVAASLASGAGSGIYPQDGTIAVTGSSGYIGAPVVTISGGTGTGATAIAEVTNGVVTGVKFTSPGQNYVAGDVLTVAFNGGGAAPPASSFTHTLAASEVAANGAGGLTKVGTGTLHVTGANTFTGDTAVTAGTLMVTGSLSGSSVKVDAGATLAGAGSVRSAEILDGGRLTPGNGPGTFTVLESLDFDATGVLTMQFNGANQAVGGGVNDLIVTHALTLAGTLNIVEISAGSFLTAAWGSRWRIADYSTGELTDEGITLGTVPNLAAGFNFVIDTSIDGRVDLVLVPEPSAAVALVGGVGLLLTSVRRRQRQ